MKLAVHSLAHPVTTLGPGARVALWVAGCSRRCPGCITPELLTRLAGWEVPVRDVLRRLLKIETSLGGITLSGGDPADQAAAVAALLRALRRERPGWNILLYTGWKIEELRVGSRAQRALLDLVDVLVDGPFIRQVSPTHPIAGSGNQRVLPLSERGETMIAAMDAAAPPAFNLAVSRDGAARLIGVSTPTERDAVHHQWGLRSLYHVTIR